MHKSIRVFIIFIIVRTSIELRDSKREFSPKFIEYIVDAELTLPTPTTQRNDHKCSVLPPISDKKLLIIMTDCSHHLVSVVFLQSRINRYINPQIKLKYVARTHKHTLAIEQSIKPSLDCKIKPTKKAFQFISERSRDTVRSLPRSHTEQRDMHLSNVYTVSAVDRILQ